MNTRILSIALGVGAALCPMGADGQTPLSFHVGGGAVAPAGDLGTYANTGWIGFVGVAKPLASNPRVAIQGVAFYAHTGHEGTSGEATNIPGVGGGVIYQLATSGTVRPYLSAGAGFLQHRYDAGTTSYGSEAESKAFVGVGGGLGFGRVFVDARYIASDGTSFMPISVGMSFGGAPRK